MSLTDWVTNTSNKVRENGVTGLWDSTRLLYNGSWRIFCSRLPVGTHIYERDWELLILLDGCRVDTLKEFEGRTEPGFVDDVDRFRSVGSTSREWLAKTFRPEYREEVGRTAYVSANPYTDEILTESGDNRSPFNPANWDTLTAEDFLTIEELWRDEWDHGLRTVSPRPVTDRAITIGRELDPDRLIVHYMQPHQPFIGEQARSEDRSWIDGNCWGALRRGETTVERVRDAYRENLELVLKEVDILLQNVDAESAVVSSDHGNAFGEWGIYGHPGGFLHPSVKDVPWLPTQATDTRTYEPSAEAEAEASETESDYSTEDRLRDLGYL